MQYLKKHINKINLQRMIVTLCFTIVCIATQRIQTAAWNSGVIEFSRNLIGVLMPVILFTHYKWQNFVKYKFLYIGWSIFGGAICIIYAFNIIKNSANFLIAGTVITALGIFLMGYCLIYTIINVFIEKNCPKFFRPLFCIWIVMMLLMIFSRSDYLWPECYFMLFGCYYMTKQTSEQRENVIWGMVDGMILGFILIQAHSLLVRPYDRVRYYGNFCNPNHNCMFMCMCLAAILAKILYVTKENRKWRIKFFYLLLAGACYSFVCMTMCRTGYLTVAVVTIFFLVAYCRIRGKKIFFRMGLFLISVFAISFPVTFLAVRYIPTIHPHVIFYFQEGYSEERVHSWDERDSEKFVSFEQLLQSIFGKFQKTSYLYEQFISGESQKQTENKVEDDSIIEDSHNLEESREEVDEILKSEEIKEIEKAENIEEKPILEKVPMLTDRQANNAFLTRYTIYKWYFDHLSFRGSPYDEQGFQLLEKHWIQDTHNIYLDYGINFGWPVMLLFTVFIWWGIVRLTKQGWQKRNAEEFACLCIVLVPPVFGLLEFSWGTGLISTIAFYFVFKEIISAKDVNNA